MNILDKLPFLNGTDTLDDLVDEAEEAKKERIAFHRAKVRNGPVSFKVPTSGQIRRERKRALARETKKARRRQVRAYLKSQQEAATLRGHLQAAGIAPYAGATKRKIDPQQALRSITWLVARFAPAPTDGSGKVEVTYEVVVQSLTSALNRWQALVGLPKTPLSPAYRLPVALSDGSVYDEA